jgi:hypothetical protein
MENLTRTTIKGRRSSRYSRLSDIESSCLILTPRLMRQILSKASKADNQSDEMKIVEEEDDEPIKVKTIKPSSLIKYLFSEKEKSYNILNSNDKLFEENELKNQIISNENKNVEQENENYKKEKDCSSIMLSENDNQNNKEETILTDCMSINQPGVSEATIVTISESVAVQETSELSNDKADQQSVSEDSAVIDKNDIPIKDESRKY